MTAEFRGGVSWKLISGPAARAAEAESELLANGYLTRLIRGGELATSVGVFREFAAALQFPWYFGNNWHAFDECFGELEEAVPDGPGVAVVVMDGERCTDSQVLRDLVTSLGYAAEGWAQSDAECSLVVVVQADTGSTPDGWASWSEAGVPVDAPPDEPGRTAAHED